MEDQETFFQDENSTNNETENLFNENDAKAEVNTANLDLSDSQNAINLNNQINSESENDPNTDLDSQEEAKNEMKSIEILDINQRDSDDVDRPFPFSPQQALKPDKTESFITSKSRDSFKEETSVKQKIEQEIFLPDNTDKTFLAPNSQKLTKSTIISDSTESNLRRKYLTYERQPQKSQLKYSSDQNLKSINRLSALPNRNIEPYKVRTLHDNLKDIDIDAVSLRLHSSKIHGRIKMNEFYDQYFKKRIRTADPLVVSERLSAKKDTRIPDSCRTIKSSPLRRNDLCVSWAWNGYN